MQFLCFASRSNPIMLHPHHHQVQRRNGRKRCLACPPWLSDHPVGCHLHELPGLQKNTGVIVHCPRVLWKTLTTPNYYNITVLYVNTCFRGWRSGICASVTGACYASHTASQVAVFGCSLSYQDQNTPLNQTSPKSNLVVTVIQFTSARW
jgi:hypothetical protein